MSPEWLLALQAHPTSARVLTIVLLVYCKRCVRAQSRRRFKYFVASQQLVSRVTGCQHKNCDLCLSFYCKEMRFLFFFCGGGGVEVNNVGCAFSSGVVLQFGRNYAHGEEES